jgi:nucleoside-diphosphate-sugar epimerase
MLTGAQGFIGAHLGNYLIDRGHEVVGIDDLSNPSQQAVRFPLEKKGYADATSLAGYDVTIHLAASINVDESILKPERYFENNVLGTLRFLETLRRTNPSCKFIYASSSEVYGSAKTPLMSEEHPLDPLSPYAVSKLAAEQLCKNYQQIHNLNITIIRHFNGFGQYQNNGIYGGAIAKFKEQGKAGRDITVFGSGEQSRDYTYIAQILSGYMLAIEKKLPLIVNFGSGSSVKIIDIANYIARKYSANVVHLPPRANEVMRLEADISKALSYGYNVQTDFWRNLDEYLDLN